MGRRHAAEAFATGAWLGGMQLSLGFAQMAGAGAAALLFLAHTAAWIAGGALGVMLGARRSTVLLATALAVAFAARSLLEAAPFLPLAVGAGLTAGALCGAYAGSFLRTRAAAWGEVRRLLLHENNGFITGYGAGALLLFVDTRALDGCLALLGLILLIPQLFADARTSQVAPR